MSQKINPKEARTSSVILRFGAPCLARYLLWDPKISSSNSFVNMLVAIMDVYREIWKSLIELKILLRSDWSDTILMLLRNVSELRNINESPGNLYPTKSMLLLLSWDCGRNNWLTLSLGIDTSGSPPAARCSCSRGEEHPRFTNELCLGCGGSWWDLSKIEQSTKRSYGTFA